MTRLLMESMAVAALFLSNIGLKAQDNSYDVFQPIAKYIGQGDAEKLSAWFSENLEITIFAS